MERRLLFLFAETSVHAGGSESLGVVDLPIQREAATELPVIWGQSLKGALRQTVRDAVSAGLAGGLDEIAMFGSRPPRTIEGTVGTELDLDDDAGQRSGELRKGAISVGDAQLLLFPAATLHNAFAWVTSPLLLTRLARKATLLGVDAPTLGVRVPHGTALGTSGWQHRQVLGPFMPTVRAADELAGIGRVLGALACPTCSAFEYTRTKLGTDVLAASDSLLTSLTKMATDVVARVQLTEKKTVAFGPFYSEHLPAETVLVSILTGPDATHLDALATQLDGNPIQLGGDETVGKGVLWCRIHDATSVRDAVSEMGAQAAETEEPEEPAGGRPPAPAPNAGSARALRPAAPGSISPAAMPLRRNQ